MAGTLLRSLLQGFGWQVGKEAATAAVKELRDEVESQVEGVADDIEKKRRARADEKAQRRAEAERVRAEARRAREIDAELDALKRRLERE